MLGKKNCTRPSSHRIVLTVTLLLTLLAPGARLIPAQADITPIIIDTDMAVDDWMAILYLLQRADVEVRAVTIAATGEAHCDPGVRNTITLLALAGNEDIPVACGRETPLRGDNTFPQMWRDGVDAMMGLSLRENPNLSGSQNAVELLRQTLDQSPEQITLVTLGPLTNIAELLQSDPALMDRFEMVYMMGGAMEVPGNLQGGIVTNNTTAEWNIYVDPVAAAQVIESGVPITIVPLDATNHAPLTMAFYEKLAGDLTTPEAEFVYRVVSSQIGFAESGGWYFWDPLAAVITSDERVVTIEDRTIRVITDEGDEFGRMMLDDMGSPVRAAVDADVNYFEQVFLNVLNGRDPSARDGGS